MIEHEQFSEFSESHLLPFMFHVFLGAKWYSWSHIFNILKNEIVLFWHTRSFIFLVIGIDSFDKKHLENILKAKTKFTLWTIEYIFTVFEFNQIKYCNELLVPALT